jgi:hypothetical protein
MNLVDASLFFGRSHKMECTFAAELNIVMLQGNPAYEIEKSSFIGTVDKELVGTLTVIESPVAVSEKAVTSGVISGLIM